MLITSKTANFKTVPRMPWGNYEPAVNRMLLRVHAGDYVNAIRSARAGKQWLDAERFAYYLCGHRAKHSQLIRQQVAA